MIYLCIPAHNEEQTVGVVLWKIRQVLTDFPRDYQILVADDASTDRTAEVLAPYARVLPLTVLRARERRGYAASLEMLLREAVRRSPYPRRDAIVTLQADFTDEPEDIVPLIKKIEQGADIVGGERASDRRPERLERWLLLWQGRLLRRVSWPDGAGDPMSGFRAYRVSTIERALETADEKRLLGWDGAIADAELLRAAAPHARRVESIDLVFRADRRQRPTRASTWERIKRLRRFVRGAAPLDTVPLSDLSPETVPPPRPLEIERERRSVAAAEPQRGRNGRSVRSGTRRPDRTDGRSARERPPRSGDRSRGERKPAAAGEEERAPRPRRPRGETAPKSGRVAPVAPADVAPGTQGVDSTAAENGVRKKRRRRRRRKSAGTGAPTQEQSQAASGSTLEGAPDTGQQGSAQAREQAGTGPVSAEDAAGSGADRGSPDAAGEAPRKRRRRGGRRGGRGRRRKPAKGSAGESPAAEGSASAEGAPEAATPVRPEHASVGGQHEASD